jgi:hypothetical protein
MSAMLTNKPKRGRCSRGAWAQWLLVTATLAPACGPAESDHPAQGNSSVVLDAPLDGSAIIDRLRETYWNCRTYRDRGELTLTYGQPGQQQSRQWTFSTAFRQPRLRFAFGPGPGIPVTPGEVRTDQCLWAQSDGMAPELPRIDGLEIRQFASLDALGTIPALLAADDVGPGPWGTYGDFRLTGFEDAGGRRCMVLHATARPPVTGVTLWVDAEQYLLRRKAVEFAIGTDGSLGREVTDYKPILDEPVDESELTSGS